MVGFINDSIKWTINHFTIKLFCIVFKHVFLNIALNILIYNGKEYEMGHFISSKGNLLKVSMIAWTIKC